MQCRNKEEVLTERERERERERGEKSKKYVFSLKYSQENVASGNCNGGRKGNFV